MPKTQSQRQARYYANQISKGLKLVKVWVPLSMIKTLRKYADKLREKQS